jgi:hypothetical protein
LPNEVTERVAGAVAIWNTRVVAHRARLDGRAFTYLTSDPPAAALIRLGLVEVPSV